MKESIDDHISNPRKADLEKGIHNQREKNSACFQKVCEKRFSRRSILKLGAMFSGIGLSIGCTQKKEHVLPIKRSKENDQSLSHSFNFQGIAHGITTNDEVALEHKVSVLLRWGDPLFLDSPSFEFERLSSDAQKKQFGYNNDFIGLIPLEALADQQERVLLCVNHEYPIHKLMFLDMENKNIGQVSAEQVRISQAASGNSIVEIIRKQGNWEVNLESKYNRRLTALDTIFEASGPAAGHVRLKTKADPAGKNIIGTLNNCAGGITPWGSYLSCEENFNLYFAGELSEDNPEYENHVRYHCPNDVFFWSKHDSRFNINNEPNEANRFGWVVEIDPLNPSSTPKKRTALGRFKHEGAENTVAKNGRLVVYMGDDQRFEYVYKFVSQDKVNVTDPNKNADLLDFGVLYVARFLSNGVLKWIPLDISNPQLSKHFNSQADLLIETRKAADIVQATPMDRPEDVVVNEKTGSVYVMLTNNKKRQDANIANHRKENRFGHIIEILPKDEDHSNQIAYWNILVECGDPNVPEYEAKWHPDLSKNGWFACPDNGVVDSDGRLWVATDQGGAVKYTGTSDGIWGLETKKELRGLAKMFYRVPIGAEACGPVFTQNSESLFVAVQHPGDEEDWNTLSLKKVKTRWPDFKKELPPRPSVVVIQRDNGKKIA